MSGRLVLIGSGETAPTMMKLHRRLVAEAPAGERSMLDTPFGFQANADDLTEKIAEYFAQSVGTTISPARWRRMDESVADREKALAQIGRSGWVFAGPGSPSYALRLWSGTAFPDAVGSVLERGGTVVFGSAAAVTAGSHALPVYEIYKVGDDPHWLPGLNILESAVGITAAVVPHYDNREGGRHDTRFCYMGESRLLELEQLLPSNVGVLGVDEHTAVVLEGSTVEVHGAGGLTARFRDREQVIPAGETLSVDQLRAWLTGEESGARVQVRESIVVAETVSGQPSLREEARAMRARFDDAVAQGHVDEALGVCLELDDVIHSWSADTLQGSDMDFARATLRAMLVDLTTVCGAPTASPRELLAPIVSVVLEARARARSTKDFAMSDLLRDGLLAAGIEVRDTPDGVEWDIK